MKNRRKLFFPSLFWITAVILSSCSDRPSKVLSEDKMVKLMVDMEIAEAYVNTQTASSSQDKLEMGERVMELHGVTKEELDTTLAWYGRNMDEYSALFEKVDKEILKRKEKFTQIPGEKHTIADNLWPYSQHLIISPLSNDESIVFSLQEPKIEKGDKIKLSLQLPNPTGIKGILGVEYMDGTGESSSNTIQQRNHMEFELTTDTAKQISRLFGVLSLKDNPKLPLFIDSISITLEPFDSIFYRNNRRGLKQFGLMRPQKKQEPEIKDTVKMGGETIEDMPVDVPVRDTHVDPRPIERKSPAMQRRERDERDRKRPPKNRRA